MSEPAKESSQKSIPPVPIATLGEDFPAEGTDDTLVFFQFGNRIRDMVKDLLEPVFVKDRLIENRFGVMNDTVLRLNERISKLETKQIVTEAGLKKSEALQVKV